MYGVWPQALACQPEAVNRYERQEMGSRDLLLGYLWQRMVEAWDRGHLLEAQSFNRYFEAIEKMSAEEYNEIHLNLDGKKVAANDSL